MIPIRRLSLPCLLLAAVRTAIFPAAAAQPPDSLYRVTAVVAGGYSHLSSVFSTPGMNKNGPSASVRLMWTPEHLLSIGIESGYHVLYTTRQDLESPEFGHTRVEASLATVPLHVTFAMRISGVLQIIGGVGGMFLLTTLDAFGAGSSTTQWSTGNFGGVSCLWPVAGSLRLGAEVKYYGIHKIKDGNLVLQAAVAFDLLRY